MARFDVWTIKAGPAFRFVIDLQSDEFSGLATTVVAPLVDPKRAPVLPGLNPQFNVGGAKVALYAQQILSLQRSRLGRLVTSLAEHEYEIMRAVDRLLSRA